MNKLESIIMWNISYYGFFSINETNHKILKVLDDLWIDEIIKIHKVGLEFRAVTCLVGEKLKEKGIPSFAVDKEQEKFLLVGDGSADDIAMYHPISNWKDVKGVF